MWTVLTIAGYALITLGVLWLAATMLWAGRR